MMKAKLCLIFLVIFLFMSASIYAKNKASLPAIDYKVLIAGLQNTESLITSGKGRWVLIYFVTDNRIYHEFDDIFAFDSDKSIEYHTAGTLAGMKYINVRSIPIIMAVEINEDGKIKRHKDQFEKFVGISISYHEPDPITALQALSAMDPRPWGLCWSKEIETCKAKIVGAEEIKVLDSKEKLPCYVLEGNSKKFWVTPKDGFRCVYVEEEGNGTRIRLSIVYKSYNIKGQKAWFPQKCLGERFAMKDGKWIHAYDLNPSDVSLPPEIPGKIVMPDSRAEVTDFQPNVDVSDMFHLDVGPEELIRDGTLSKLRPFKELDWKY